MLIAQTDTDRECEDFARNCGESWYRSLSATERDAVVAELVESMPSEDELDEWHSPWLSTESYAEFDETGIPY